jgi:hypothetical protein
MDAVARAQKYENSSTHLARRMGITDYEFCTRDESGVAFPSGTHHSIAMLQAVNRLDQGVVDTNGLIGATFVQHMSRGSMFPPGLFPFYS